MQTNNIVGALPEGFAPSVFAQLQQETHLNDPKVWPVSAKFAVEWRIWPKGDLSTSIRKAQFFGSAGDLHAFLEEKRHWLDTSHQDYFFAYSVYEWKNQGPRRNYSKILPDGLVQYAGPQQAQRPETRSYWIVFNENTKQYWNDRTNAWVPVLEDATWFLDACEAHDCGRKLLRGDLSSQLRVIGYR